MAKKFLTQFPIDNIKYLTMDELPLEGKYDLVISNYAFTECTYAIQKRYTEKILEKSRNGFIKCNYLTTIFTLRNQQRKNY